MFWGLTTRGNLALLCSLVGEGGSLRVPWDAPFFPCRLLQKCHVWPAIWKNWLRVNEITPPWGKSKKQQMGLGNFGVICRLKHAMFGLVSRFMTPAVRFLHSLLLEMDEKTWNLRRKLIRLPWKMFDSVAKMCRRVYTLGCLSHSSQWENHHHYFY